MRNTKSPFLHLYLCVVFVVKKAPEPRLQSRIGGGCRIRTRVDITALTVFKTDRSRPACVVLTEDSTE